MNYNNIHALHRYQGTQITMRDVNEGEKRDLLSAFHAADLGHKGYLSKEDVKIAVVALFGYKPSKYEVGQMYEKAKLPDDSCINFDHFVTLMTPKMITQDEDEEIRQAFVAMDTHCRGFLVLEDLYKVFSLWAPRLPQHTIETVFREIDRNGDRRVSYKDFEFMMKYNSEDHR